ncbi:L,D-transpeptidase family protein [Actinoplanes sp. NPDC049599]|uniref:L,D-transpeptidase n=1 Tax=Actinoplanes sp. NPDC049599 TaxID=3363903 RepID=UPI0037887BAD
MSRTLRLTRTRAGLLGLAACVAAAAGLLSRTDDRPVAAPRATAAPSPSVAPRTPEPTLPASPAPPGLPVLDYWTAPRGFPADPAPLELRALTQGLHPTRSIAVYDAPGGRPRARLRPEISGMTLVLPITDRRAGWVAVLLPTANRRIGWLPPRGWSIRPLRDHLIVQRRSHKLIWRRDGVRRAAWTVATGTAETPTPLGRSFVLGRTPTSGSIYGGLDALALNSVPESRRFLPASLRGAHTGIHGWHRADDFGRSASNGCIRMPRAAQRTLLKNIDHGTVVTVVD